RHTRFSRDWSSDVCSSDLNVATDMQTLTRRRLLAHGAVALPQHMIQIALPQTQEIQQADAQIGFRQLQQLAARWRRQWLRFNPRSEERRVGEERRSRWQEE